jgi:uncharacterized membrane protein YuzA (DUF378 family)
MLGIILRVIALILFVVAALNQTLFGQPELDLIAWALAAWVLATLVGGYGPQWPVRQA